MGGKVTGWLAALGVVALCVLAAAAPNAAAQSDGEEPPFVDWNPLLPSLANPYHPSRERDCVDGSPACIEETLSEMYRRFDSLYATCDHNAAFAITYIRVTEEIREAILDGFYGEPDFLHHEDKVFARMYFESYDAWASGRRELVSPAWLEAYDAGRDRTVSGQGSLLMAMNAHINRDFPFLLDALGLTKPDGSSRKPDHDRGNVVLNRLYGPVLKELSERFDPTVDDANAEGSMYDDTTIFQVLQGWREQVWRHAEMLGAAQTPEQRKLVADYIEQYALGIGRQIEAATTIESSAARDEHCAAYRRTHREEGGQLAVVKRKRALRARGRSVRVRVACPAGRDCAGTLVLQRHGRDLTRPKRATLAGGQSRVLRLRLNRSGRRSLRHRRGRTGVRALTASPSPWGTTRTAAAKLRLKRAGSRRSRRR